MDDKKEYTIAEVKRHKADICRKINDMITDFVAKYDVIVLTLHYEIGEYKHRVDMVFKVD